MLPFHTVTLPSGLIVEFHDLSNRYFGDYWRVSVEMCCRIPIGAVFDQADPEFERARILLGEEVLYRRTLEKMGVPGDEVALTCRALVDNFLQNTASYLSDPTFAPRLVRKELAERKGKTRPFLVPK